MLKVLYWIVAIPLAAALVIFSVNNRSDVVLDLWPLDLASAPLPVFSIVLAALFAGFLAGAAVAWLSGAKARRRARQEARRAADAERALADAEARADRLQADADAAAQDRPKLPADAA